MTTARELERMAKERGLPPGGFARAVQVVENEVYGASRQRVLTVIGAGPEWWKDEPGLRILIRGRLQVHGIRSPQVLDHWWLAVEVALGAYSPTPGSGAVEPQDAPR